jgi:hypothetical protein
MLSDQRCAHEGCHCMTDGPDAVVLEGKAYCCAECASGQGCHHAGCDCSTHMAADSDPASMVPVFPMPMSP